MKKNEISYICAFYYKHNNYIYNKRVKAYIQIYSDSISDHFFTSPTHIMSETKLTESQLKILNIIKKSPTSSQSKCRRLCR